MAVTGPTLAGGPTLTLGADERFVCISVSGRRPASRSLARPGGPLTPLCAIVPMVRRPLPTPPSSPASAIPRHTPGHLAATPTRPVRGLLPSLTCTFGRVGVSWPETAREGIDGAEHRIHVFTRLGGGDVRTCRMGDVVS